MKTENGKNFVIISLFICVVLFLAWCLYWCGMRYKTSSEAFIDGGHPISIASRVDGQVKEVFANNNQVIKTGSVIVELESEVYQSNFEKISSRQNEIKLKLDNQKKLLLEAKTTFESASKAYENAKSKLVAIEVEYAEAVEMYKEGILSKSDYDKVLEDLTVFQAKFTESEKVFEDANQKFSSLNNDVRALEAELKKLELGLAQAKYNLTNTKIYAPENGQVVDLEVKKGDFLKASQVFMTLIPQKIWIVATYKNSQFESVENGQAVWIKIDSVANKKFKGHIDSIISDDNAGGLVTVKVLFDENLEDYDIKPGKSIVLKLRERG